MYVGAVETILAKQAYKIGEITYENGCSVVDFLWFGEKDDQ